MIRKLSISLLLLGVLCAGLLPAQDAAPKPEFNDAPVTEVLLWAQKSIGCGFIYDGEVLKDPATGQVRRVTAQLVEPATRPEKTLLLFELLKRAGLVPFEVGGMPGPTYQLYGAEGAARNAAIVQSREELDGLYFASLSIRLRSAPVQSVAIRVQDRLTPGIGSVETFEDTHSMIVTDYVERLYVAWEIARTADTPTTRDDDLVVSDFAVRSMPAERLAAALERLREKNEEWKSTLNEFSNVLLISGRRDTVELVIERARKLDAREPNPAFEETTSTIKLIYVKPADAVNTLRDLFKEQVESGSVQIGAFERDRKVVFRGSSYDAQRAQAAVKVIDVQPEKK